MIKDISTSWLSSLIEKEKVFLSCTVLVISNDKPMAIGKKGRKKVNALTG